MFVWGYQVVEWIAAGEPMVTEKARVRFWLFKLAFDNSLASSVSVFWIAGMALCCSLWFTEKCLKAFQKYFLLILTEKTFLIHIFPILSMKKVLMKKFYGNLLTWIQPIIFEILSNRYTQFSFRRIHIENIFCTPFPVERHTWNSSRKSYIFVTLIYFFFKKHILSE